MRKLLITFALLLFALSHSTSSLAQKPVAKFNLRDFYFYDESGVMNRLDIAPKIAVRFLKNLPASEQNQFLEKFSPIAQKKDDKGSSVIILEFPSSTAYHQIIEKLNEMSESDIAETAPIVYINNIEAIADGIVIEPKTLLSAEALEKRIRRFGNFELRQSKMEQQRWVFFLAEVKPPLHILLLTNLVNKDSWVKRAYPHFKYLHDPIVSTLEVEPVSGTVNEARIIRFSIKIFDPAINLKEDLLPNFGEGKFIPVSGDSSPQPLFFFLDGDGDRREFFGAKSRTVVFSWKFHNYAIGEWVISGQSIQYEKNGVLSNITSPQASMVVTSLVGNLAVNDMPSPKTLTVPNQKYNIKPTTSASLPATLPYWFERWIEAKTATRYSFLAIIYLSGAAIFLCLLTIAPHVAKWVKKQRQENQFFRNIEKICNEAAIDASLGSYKKLEDAARRIEKKFSEKSILDNETRQSLSSIYQSLSVMHAPDFSPESHEVRNVVDKILSLLKKGGKK